jgi:demethylmenaquinone methyltransferase / 2-methoxy-6-polyprenyl-1,4-benzoquinol methylase
MEMRSLRRRFYDLFSRGYDRFVRLHSGDEAQGGRRFLVERLDPQPGEYVLDVCTGTGEIAIRLARRLEGRGRVLGLDFSRGMLSRAREKQAPEGLSNLSWTQADASKLPLCNASMNRVSFSHALYEIKDFQREQALKEVVRILSCGGLLALMEHAVPEDRLTRLMLRLRSFWTGGIGSARQTLERTEGLQGAAELLSPSGKSWLSLWRRVGPATGEEG